MHATEQAKRLVNFDGSASGNALVGLWAVAGVVGWGMTVAAGRLGGSQVAVTVAWTVVWFGALAWGYLGVDREAVWTLPTAVWIVVTVAATGVNGYAVAAGSPELVWLPWFGAFAVGYLATALLVVRSGVYWAAGLTSTVLFGFGVYAAVTNTGHVVDTVNGTTAVFVPLPFTYVLLGLLHVVPMAIDAARGGREMTDAGAPALRADQSGSDDGGVVPSD